MYGQGISKAGDVLDCAVDAKVIEKAGSWYSYNGERIGQGRENVKEYLQTNPQVMSTIEQQLLDNLREQREQSRRGNGTQDSTASDLPKGMQDLRVDEDGVVIE